MADVDFTIINGNYALAANLTDSVLLIELTNTEAVRLYADVLAAKERNENSEKTRILIEAFKSEGIAEFIGTQFGKLVVLVFKRE